MSHPKKIVSSKIENINIKNYHDPKNITVSKKTSPSWAIYLHVVEMSQNPP